MTIDQARLVHVSGIRFVAARAAPLSLPYINISTPNNQAYARVCECVP